MASFSLLGGAAVVAVNISSSLPSGGTRTRTNQNGPLPLLHHLARLLAQSSPAPSDSAASPQSDPGSGSPTLGQMSPVELLAIVVVCTSLLLLCCSALHRRQLGREGGETDAEASAADRATAQAAHARQRAKNGLPVDVRTTFHTIVYHPNKALGLPRAYPEGADEGTEGMAPAAPGPAASLTSGSPQEEEPAACHVALDVREKAPGTAGAPADEPSPNEWEVEHPLYSGPAGTSCVVCLADFEDGETLLQLPCSHAFHVDCVTSWFDSHVTCPVCRLPLLKQRQEEQQQHQQGVEDREPLPLDAPPDLAISVPQEPEAEQLRAHPEVSRTREENARGAASR